MKIRLEVLASASIKRKKPWPQISWLGKERESLFLLDDKRVSVLYVPSGKTKRNVPRLSSLLPETVYLTSSPGGLYLVGVQSSGEIFVWHKDKDELKTICGLASVLQGGEITPSDGCKAFPSPDCSQILLVLANQLVFLWQRESSVSDAKNNTLLGKWSKVTPPRSIHLPASDCKEACMHAVFTSTEAFGYCCQLSIVFNQRANLNVASLLIRFSPDIIAGQSAQHSTIANSTWTSLQNPLKNIQAGCEPLRMQGAYRCRYTHDGAILAIGVNQKSPTQTSVLFISPFTETVLVSDLRGCGLKDPSSKRGRQYWISEMTWTFDNLFLAVMLRNGSAGLLSRLGEPLVIYSRGCSVEIGPAYFLPFTPLISVQPDRRQVQDGHDLNPSANSELDPLHQRFSVSSHPSLPILLFSDGYLVTIAQLPSEMSPMIFMRDMVLESSSHLRQIAETHRLDLTLANAYNLPAGELESVKSSPRGIKHGRPNKKGNSHYSFEDPSISLNETLDSEVSFALGVDEASGGAKSGAVKNVNSGKIVFGEPDVLMVTEGSFLNEPNSTMKALQLARVNLFNVWKLAASTTEMWSANMDKILNHAVHNVIKLFSLILDCSHIKDILDEAVDQIVNSPAVNTASLFKVISMYKQLLDLLQFDCQQRHLLASVLQLSHKTLLTILSSVGLRESDPRLKTLTGCFTLLKFTEKSIQHTYVAMPKILLSKGLTPKVMIGVGDGQLQIGGGEGLHTDSQLAKRLTATWKLLYKSVAQFLASNDVSAADFRQAQVLHKTIQQSLIELDAEIPRSEAPTINTGERFSLDGKHTLAMDAWKEQLKKFQEVGNVKNAARLFHSLLYTYILRNDLVSAVSFVDSLIVKANPGLVEEYNPDVKTSSHNIQPSLMTFVTSTLKSQAFHEPDMVPCIRDKAIRQVVQTMARFMAAYFSNQTVFIYPPHNPTPLPAVHFETSIANSRIIPKYPEDMTVIIRQQKLGSVWTVERTLEYLLLSGLICEAVWFADRMGDWKAAYQLSVAHTIHKRLAPQLYVSPKKPLTLPEWLTSETIMKRRLERLIKDDLQLTNSGSSDLSHLTKILEDISLSGVMGFVEVGPWLLEELVSKLKSLVKQLSPLVTKDFYLPAPPLYCPQPPRTDKTRYSLEAEDEMKFRQKASSIIQLALCVMNATHLSIPAVRWYVQVLDQVQKKATQFKANIEGPCFDLPDGLYQFLETESEFKHPADDSSIRSVQSSFRDLCSLLWLLHARDKLSIALRSREKYLNLGLDVDDAEKWLRECFFTLQWAVQLVSFSRYLSDEASIYKVVLSLLLDLPATEDTANILAEHMYDLENLHPEVQERLDRLLNDWQSVILIPEADGKSVGDSLDMDEEGRKSVTFLGASPRGKSLSVYFHKQCMIMDKVLKKKKQCYGAYEEFVFSDVKEKSSGRRRLHIGSRPFETKRSYIDFLDTFVSVSFSRILEIMSGMDKVAGLPFLRSFVRDIADREMQFFVKRAASLAHKKQQGLSVLSGASHAALERASSQERVYPARTPSKERTVPGRTTGRFRAESPEDQPKRSKSNRPVGLFRGKSMIDAPIERSHATVRRYESEPGLDDLDLNDVDASEAGPSSKSGHSRQNLSELASRFTQSEENIYRGSTSRDKGKPVWSLTVNFGKKYTVLQQLLEWLEVWGNKSHALGIPDREEILDISPKMKIQIPAQLIILALWLLEHKYNRGSATEEKLPKTDKRNRGRRAERLSRSRSPYGSGSQSPVSRTADGKGGTSPRQAGSSHISRQTAAKLAHQPPGTGQQSSGSRHTSPARRAGGAGEQGLMQSMQPSTLEQDEIIDAYTQVLDGPEDSSSIDVSSLASDELDGDMKNTLNILRKSGTSSPQKDNSALNHTMFPKDGSPERGGPVAPHPKDSSTPVKQAEVAAHRTPSVSPPPHGHSHASEHSHSRSSRNKNQSRGTSPPREPASQSANQNLGQGLANQLQGIIRDELRRIMEVQHRSVLAMMGALDGISPAEVAPMAFPSNSQANQASLARPVPPSTQPNMGSPIRSRRHPQVGTSPTRHNKGWPYESERDEDESMAEIASFQEEIIAHSSARTHAHKKEDRRAGRMRETLTELHNLQSETHQARTAPQPTSFSEDISARANRVFSNYPGPPQSGNLNLPFLPLQAWPDTSSHHQTPATAQGALRLPLLHIDQPSQQSDPFHNLRRFLPQVPPPQAYAPQSLSHSQPPYFQPPPPSQPASFSFFAPPSQPQRHPPPPYEQPLPLLSAPSETAPPLPSGFPLLKMLPPGAGFESSEAQRQRETMEEMRHKLLKKFHEQVLQDKENADRQILGQQMLHLEASGELESARTEKSTVSHRSVPESVKESEHDEEAEEQRAPSAQSIHEEQKVDAATSDTRINDGYALPRGVFESYLQLGQQLVGPEVNETNAAFQMRMAMAMQKQVEKRIKAKVDFSTMTQEQVDAVMATDPAMEVVRTAEAATSITKDTGVDPIQEALNEYNLKHHNNLIPPDIFMGLRFGDQDSQTGQGPAVPSDAPGKGRSYLNVVDIRASSILRDIPERKEKAEGEVDQEKMDTALRASAQTAHQIEAMEDTLRQKFAPKPREAQGYDSVTVKMFDELRASRDDMVSVAVMPRSSKSEPKSAMIRRLRDMSDQIKAIDEMSQNIERDFKSSHLLLSTIQDVNASIERARSPSPERVRPRKHKELRYSLEEEEEEDTLRQPSQTLPTPKSSAKSPQASARSAKSRSTVASRSGELLSRTESELTDLITEVLAQEGVDLQSAGYSQELAQQLEKDAREQIQRERKAAGYTPRDKLISMKKADEHLKQRSEAEKEQLKQWMKEKFRERQEQYKRKRNELIEREPKPFKSNTTITTHNLKLFEEEQNEKRLSMMSEFMNQRLLEAEHLIGDIIVDKPEIPWSESVGDVSHRRAASRSPRRTGSSTSPTRPGVPRKSRSPRRTVSAATSSYKPMSSSRSPHMTRTATSIEPSPMKSILKPSVTEPRPTSADIYTDHRVLASISEGDGTVDSSIDIINYARHVLEMDSSERFSPVASMEEITKSKPRQQPATQPGPSAKTAKKAPATKGKSYADMVRMQRPQVTQKWRDINRQRLQQEEVARLSARQKAAAQDPNLAKEKTKDYGSKHIPGSSPRQATAPKRVKTYSERLQEMKPKTRTYSPPASRRTPGSARTMTTSSMRPSARRGPPHKPQTYVEQLQNLGSRAPSTYRSIQSGPARKKIPVQMRTFMKSRKPAHKPKTYAEQLQALNPHPHADVHVRKPMQSTVTVRSSVSRSQARARPYNDPYSEVDYEELASVLSDWDMDENVRNIIYGGTSVSSSAAFMVDGVDVSMSGGDMRQVAPSEAPSDYFDAVMRNDSVYRPGDGDDFGVGDYRSSVDIHEIERIADMASVGSGSVLSVIDWDAVEDLIKDE